MKMNLLQLTEVIMMGIDSNKRKSAPFPSDYHQNIANYYNQQGTNDWPKQLGHQIGIPKRRTKNGITISQSTFRIII